MQVRLPDGDNLGCGDLSLPCVVDEWDGGVADLAGRHWVEGLLILGIWVPFINLGARRSGLLRWNLEEEGSVRLDFLFVLSLDLYIKMNGNGIQCFTAQLSHPLTLPGGRKEINEKKEPN